MRLAPCLAAVAVIVAFSPLFVRPERHGARDWGKELLDATAAREAIVRHREPPLWNRYCGGGNLLAGNPETFCLSPAFVLVLLLGAPLGLKASIVGHALLGAWGMGRLVRDLGGSVEAAALGGGAWAVTGHVAIHVAVGHVQWQAAYLLPWVLAPWVAVPGRGHALAAAALGLMLLDGGVHVALVALVALAGLAAARAVSGGLRAALPLAAAVVSGVALAGVKLVPALALLEVDPHRVASHAGFTVPLVVWSLLVPVENLDHLWPGVDLAEGGGIWEYASYVGVLLLPLVGVALISDPRTRGRLELWLLALLGLTFSFEMPGPASPWRLLHLVPPFAMERRPSRFLLISVLVVVVWAALGLDGIIARRPRLALLLALGIAGDLGLATARLMVAATSVATPKVAACDGVETRGHGSPYVNLLAGCGTVPCRQGLHLRQAARGVGDEGYRGEAFVAEGGEGATADVIAATSRSFDVAYTVPSGGLVVLNQNAWPGFRVEGGELATVDGLVAARVAPGSGQLHFAVLAGKRELLGAFASLLGATGIAMLHRRFRSDGGAPAALP